MNQVFRAHDAATDSRRGVYPPVNLLESEEGFVLTAEIPGVAPDALDVSIEGTTVTLAGSRKEEHVTADEPALHRRERSTGTFRRAFQLPAEIDLDKARATHRHGVLTLDLPKSPALKPRQIQVETP
jgi:HSP20 family protein